MDPQTYKRIEAIIDELLGLEPEERQRRVAELTRTEPDLWPRIEELLAADDRLESAPLMATPLEHTWSKEQALGLGTAVMPERIGRYRVLSQLGEGGMGSVYQAEETVPVRREVAIKVTHGIQSPRQQARFALEAQALAMMRHPNIASLYEFGATDEGAPFVVMELIDGSTNILEWCDRQKATLAVRVELFLQVCAGVAHAHEKGILHRDLKPANVLIAEVDGEPTVKVIDFGIARSFGGEGTQTITQDLAGSPVYMSPEAAGVTESQHADTRSDVYSLGLLFCELISGELPFDPGSGLAELLSRMRNREVQRPSDRIRRLDEDRRTELAALRSTTPARWLRGLSGDLDAIVLKSVEFDRERRYPSPRDLARDLRRHLAREPISARPAEWGYVLRRFLWKRKGWVAAVLAVMLSLSGGLISRSIEAQRAREAAQRAEESALEAAQVANFLQDLFEVANPRRRAKTPPTVMELLDLSATRLETELVDQPKVRAKLLLRISQVNSNLGRTEDAEALAELALRIAESLVEPDNQLVADVANSLGIIKKDLRKFDEAEPLLRRAIELYGGMGVAELNRLAEVHLNLGGMFGRRRQNEAAIEHTQYAVDIWEQNPELDAKGLPSALYNLSVFESDPAESLKLNERALEAARRHFEPDHPTIGHMLSGRGVLEESLGRLSQADQTYREAEQVLLKRLPPEHPAVAMLTMNRGALAYLLGNWDEAADRCLAADKVFAEREGAVHAVAPKLLWKAAEARRQQGRLNDAERILEDLRQRRSGLDPDDPVHDGTKLLQSIIALSRGDFARAEAGFRPLAEYYCLERSAYTATAFSGLGEALAAQGRIDEARTALESAIGVWRTRKKFTVEFADTLEAAAEVAARSGLVEEARGHAGEALSMRERTFGAEHPATVRIGKVLEELAAQPAALAGADRPES